MKVLTVIGARPQFIKAGAVSRVLRESIHEIYVHTGQHYDENMSDVFFKELAIPEPDYNLGVGSGSHAAMTGEMLTRLEEIYFSEKPDCVIVYGDTNSTLAGALAAVKINIPVVHVEAGLRSYNRQMPEEINRVLTDHVSSLLFCPSQASVTNLAAEGICKNVFIVGDVMMDSLAYFTGRAASNSTILSRLGLREKEFILLTLHRAENVDDRERMTRIIDAIVDAPARIVFPVHPRTHLRLTEMGLLEKLQNSTNILLTEPVGYLDMVQLERSSCMILTDSGGVQKEAYWFSVPCLTIRDETEWTETVDLGWNRLVGTDSNKIRQEISTPAIPAHHPVLYGDGKAGEKIRHHLVNFFSKID